MTAATNPERYAVALRLLAQGCPKGSAAQAAGVSRETLWKWLNGVHRPRYGGDCGTNSGYSAHRRRGQRPCLECFEAHAATGRRQYRRGRAS